MSTTLSQSPAAAHPDRGQLGLLVSLTAGNEGAYLRHDLGSARNVLHTRLAMRADGLTGGAVRIAGGLDAASGGGAEAWWLDYDADERRIELRLPSGETFDATLNALPWQCIEVRLDAAAGEAKLWINGVLTGELAGVSVSATRYAWIGALFKDTALAGALHLDEWMLGEAMLGPVHVAAPSAHADDPARWLVIYNDADPDAATWAEAYRAARGVPYANLLGLPLPTSELIDAVEFAALVDAINTHLATAGLAEQVVGILAGYRVPGYVDFGDGQPDAVAALLHRDSALPGLWTNADAADTLPVRPTAATLEGNRLTARIDGPDLAGALALIDRATTLIDAGLGDGAAATLWFDPFIGSGVLYDEHVQRMLAWAASVDRQRTRLPFMLSGDPDQPDQDAAFASIHDDAFFWGWRADVPPTVPAGFFADPAGPRVVSAQLHLLGATATTLRAATPGNWIDTALAAGYAAAVGTSRVYSGSAVPYARPFFEALRRGWTLAEAWYVAQPLLREGLYLVGDPLLRVALPAAGWDVFGPLDRLEALDPDTPSAALRVDERELAVEPADGMYLVRCVDGHGRAEASVRPVRVTDVAGAAARPPVMPVWPIHAGWPAAIEGGEVVLPAVWERVLRAARVASVELLGEVDGGAEAVLWTAAPDERERLIETRQPLPAASARYRWRVTSPDGVAAHTPWSRIVRPREASAVNLNVMEVRP